MINESPNHYFDLHIKFFSLLTDFIIYFSATSALERLNSLTTTVLDSIDKYQSINNNDNKVKKCDNLNCRVKRILLANESWSDYINLFKNYIAEEKYTGSEELNSQSHTDTNNNQT